MPLVVGSIATVGSFWGAARLWLVYHRPALVGAATNSDAGPDPTALALAASLLLVGVGLASALVFARRCSVRARRIAMAVLTVGLTLAVGSSVSAADSSRRCSNDGYSGTSTCVSGGEARASDVRNVLLPGLAALACLALGARVERLRSEKSDLA